MFYNVHEWKDVRKFDVTVEYDAETKKKNVEYSTEMETDVFYLSDGSEVFLCTVKGRGKIEVLVKRTGTIEFRTEGKFSAKVAETREQEPADVLPKYTQLDVNQRVNPEVERAYALARWNREFMENALKVERQKLEQLRQEIADREKTNEKNAQENVSIEVETG